MLPLLHPTISKHIGFEFDDVNRPITHLNDDSIYTWKNTYTTLLLTVTTDYKRDQHLNGFFFNAFQNQKNYSVNGYHCYE